MSAVTNLPAAPFADRAPIVSPEDVLVEPAAPGRRLARLALQIDVPGRWALLIAGAAVAWRTRDLGWDVLWLAALLLFAATAVITTGYWVFGRRERPPRTAAWAIYGAFFGDALFAGALIWRDGGIGSPFYLLLLLLALKTVGLSPVLPGMVWAPFALGPLYVLALRLQSGNLAFVIDPGFLVRYLLLWVILVGLVLFAWEFARRAARAAALEAALVEQQVALAQKTEVLQRTATDLGDRVLELRSLQEVAKALASTLRREETLQLIVERLRGITGSSHCAVALADADSGVLDGVLATEKAAATPFHLYLGAEAPTLAALRSGRIVRVGRGEAVETPLHRLLGAAEYSITPLVSRGLPIGALYLVYASPLTPEDTAEGDASGRARTEQLLASFAYFAATAIENAQLYGDAWEKRRELEAVLAGIGDGVVVVDPELHLILMNPVARHILELEEEPPVGVPLRPYLPAPDFADLLSDTLQSQREQIRELCLGGESEDTQRTLGALASPVLDADGEVSGVVAVLRDITAQKELERMKSNFLSVVSHELRTPLHSIRGFVEIILMGKTGPVTELQEDFLRTVRSQTIVLQRMIDDLLEFSRMEAGRVKLNLSEVPLAQMANAVASKLVPLAEEGGLTLSLDVPEDLPEIDGDRVRLEQVLTNLVENAIKFTPSGGHIHISGTQSGERVHLIVADTGIGIPADELERIFDRFYQVDSSERRAYRGTGLGLSICKHIIERHQGRIWADSEGEPGRGSRFHIELPVELHLAEAPTIDFTTPARQA